MGEKESLISLSEDICKNCCLFFPYFFKQFVECSKLPERSSWNRDLERWSAKAGKNPKVSPKTPRTIESWMLKTGISEIEIYSRQGHDIVTSLVYYQSLSSKDNELRHILI